MQQLLKARGVVLWSREGCGVSRKCLSLAQLERLTWSASLFHSGVVSARCIQQTPSDAMEFLLSKRMRRAELLLASQCQWSLTQGWWEAVLKFSSLFRRKEIISWDNQRVGWFSHFSFVSSFVYAKWKNVLHPENFFPQITFLPVENMLINSINSYHQALRQPSSQDSTQTAVCVYLNVSGFNLFLYHPPLTCLTQLFGAWASVVAAHSGHSSGHGGNTDLTSGHK